MQRAHPFGAVVLLAVACLGCSSSPQLAGAPEATTPSQASVVANEPPVPPTAGDGAAVTEPAPAPDQATNPAAETIPVITSDIVGTAPAGNSGGVGENQTDSYSESVRNDDGTCSGWAGRNVPAPWTQGLVSGAPFVILARDDDTVLGQGTLGTSSYENVGTEDNQRWQCNFPFSATVTGTPTEFRIQVEGLEPWVARADPSHPGAFVASVNTVASAEYFSECTDPTAIEVTEWQAVGQYWSSGLPTLCANGLTIAEIKRPCRAQGEASDFVTKVTAAGDPNTVYEDASGLQVDVSTLAAGTPVTVYVATGRPCG